MLDKNYRAITIRFVSVLILFVFSAAAVQSQTLVKRYIIINKLILPINVYIAPEAPTNFSFDLAPPNGVLLEWGASADATDYRIEHKTPSSSLWVTYNVGTATNFPLFQLDFGSHSFRVKSCGGDLCSEPTATTVVEIALSTDSDIDGDGISDINDECGGTATGVSVDAQGCSLTQLDSDGDGVNDASDQCPGSIQSVNSHGCDTTQIDTDNDGVNDAYDQCPNTSAIANSVGCTASQLDTDNDGVNDALDQCPDTSSDFVDQNGCALPNSDGDADGIPDYFDNTPTQCVDVSTFDASN